MIKRISLSVRFKKLCVYEMIMIDVTTLKVSTLYIN